MTDHFCMYPWTNLEFRPNGEVKPCCVIGDPIKIDGKVFNINSTPDFSVEDLYFSDQLVALRQEFRDGKKPTACNKCWIEEAAGKSSDRQLYFHHARLWKKDVDFATESISNLKSFDLKLGNICNLSCRTCNSMLSSTWAAEELSIVARDVIKQHPIYLLNNQCSWPKQDNNFWTELEKCLPSLRFLQITGGEPLMIPYHYEFLKIAIERGFANRIELRYNSNGTIYPEEAFELWKHFGKVKIGFSIDNIEQRYELERNRGKWNEVVANMRKFNRHKTKRFTTEVCCTVNVQNVLYLPEFCNWFNGEDFDTLFLNLLHGPDRFSIRSLTPAAKDLVLGKLESHDFGKHQSQVDTFISIIKHSPGSDGQDFVKYMKKLDLQRGQDFAKSHSEIASAMNYL